MIGDGTKFVEHVKKVYANERVKGNKEKLEENCLTWIEEIKKSEGGYTEIDLPKVFRMMFTRNIIHISFGEDISKEEIEIWYAKDKNKPKDLELTKMSFGLALEQVGA